MKTVEYCWKIWWHMCLGRAFCPTHCAQGTVVPRSSNRPITLGAWILIFCLVTLSRDSLAATRVALVTTDTKEATAQSISLITAELSGDKSFELLDRESILAVVQEQKLSLIGSVDAERMIQVGKLLKTDLFAVVETDQRGGAAMGLVVFDAATGLRLWDAAVSGNPEQAAASIVVAIRAANAKDHALNQGVRLIAFLPVRNADLPRDKDLCAEALRLLLERQLTSSPGVAVLERGRLEHVNQERQLPADRGPDDLWPSVVNVQLEISRPPKGQGIRASAILSTASGRKLDELEATIDGDSVADLAEKLRERLIASLKVKTVGRPFDRGEEARRFSRDAVVLTQSTRYAAGASAAEAAYALQPNDDHQLILSNALFARAWECLTPNDVQLSVLHFGGYNLNNTSQEDFDRGLAFASRALQMQRAAIKTILTYPHPNRGFLDYTGGEIRITWLRATFARLNTKDTLTPASRAALVDFRAEAITYLLEYFDGWARDVKTNPGDLPIFNAEFLYTLGAAAGIVGDIDSFIVARNHLFHTWISAFNSTWEHSTSIWIQSGKRQSLVMMELLIADGRVRQLDHYTDEVFIKSLKPIADELNHSSHPAIRMYGFIASVLCNPEISKRSPTQSDDTLKALMQLLESSLTTPGSPSPQSNEYVYIAAVDGIHLLPEGTQSSNDIAIDFLNQTLRRKHVIPFVTLNLLFQQISPSQTDERSRDWLEVLTKTVELSRTTDGNGLDGNADGVRQLLTEEISNLRRRHPELGPATEARPWESVKRIVDVNALPGITRLEEFPQVAGEQVCFLGSGLDADGKFFIQAFQVALDGNPPKALGKIGVAPLRPVGNGYWPFDGFGYRLIQGGAVDAQNYYVSVRSQGVFVFPRDGTAPSRIDKTQGLPSDWARSLVAKDGFLYIVNSSDDGCYLTRWNPRDKSTDVLISSLRKETRSPLDNTPGIRIRFMVDDAPRNRLILSVGQYSVVANTRWSDMRGGLWFYDTTNGRMDQQVTTTSGLDLGSLRGIDHDALFTANTIWVARHDLETNQSKYLSYKPGMLDGNYVAELAVREKTIKGTGWSDPGTERAGTRRVIDGWLWLGEPFSRISGDTRTVELLDAQLKPDAKPIGPVWTMEHIGLNRILLGDIRQLYVATLHNPSDATQGTHINLMPLIDTDKDLVSGEWRLDLTSLKSDGSFPARINIPYDPPEEYDFHIEFTRENGNGDVAQIMSHGGGQFLWAMGAYGNTCDFFANIDRSYIEYNPTRVKSKVGLTNAQKHRSIVKVRKNSVSSYLDGTLVAYRETDFSDFSMPAVWHLEPGTLGVGSWGSITRFNVLELIEVTGHGKSTPHLNPGAVRSATIFDENFTAPRRAASQPAIPPIHNAERSIPTDSEQAKSRDHFRQTYIKEIADRSHDARRAFADQLIAAAETASTNSFDRFVLLMAARQCAIEGIDLERAAKVVELLGATHDIDPLKLTLDATMQIGGRSDTAVGAANNCRAGLQLIDRLLAADNVGGALAAGTVLKSTASLDPMYSLIIRKKLTEIESVQSAPGTKRLKSNPSTPPWHVVDLLSIAKPESGAVHGEWRRTAQGLASDGSKARFEFPYRPPSEYLVRIEFTRLAANDGMDICVARGSGSACWTVGGWGNTVCAFQAVDGFAPDDNPIRSDKWLQNGQRMVSCLEVRNGMIRGYLNGNLLCERKTDLHDMHDPHVETRAADVSRLGITTWESPTLFHRVDVLEITGTGEIIQ